MAFPRKNYEKLKEALLHAFNEDELKQLVQYELKESLDEIVSKGNLSSRVFDLIEWAGRRGRVEELFQAALAKNSGSPHLQALTAPPPGPGWIHRMDLVPSMWTAKWHVNDGQPIREIMQIKSWIDENEFEGYGFSEHGTESQPKTFNYSFNGRIEPVGVILLEYRAERYPVAGAKNVGIAALEIESQNKLVGYFSGYRDKRDRAQLDRDRMTYPEESVENGKFYIPFGSMTYYGGTVEMLRSGRGA